MIFRENEEKWIARLVFFRVSTGLLGPNRIFRFRLESVITDSRPPKAVQADPTKTFWTTYKEVADEHDNDMIAKYTGALDSSLLFVSTFPRLVRIVLS